jgi:hypothetical protein
MKRPFDIGTFPKNNKIKTFHNLDFRKSRFYCAIETEEPIMEEDILKYELTKINNLNKSWIL